MSCCVHVPGAGAAGPACPAHGGKSSKSHSKVRPEPRSVGTGVRSFPAPGWAGTSLTRIHLRVRAIRGPRGPGAPPSPRIWPAICSTLRGSGQNDRAPGTRRGRGCEGLASPQDRDTCLISRGFRESVYFVIPHQVKCTLPRQPHAALFPGDSGVLFSPSHISLDSPLGPCGHL